MQGWCMPELKLICSRPSSITEVSARWCAASTFPLLGSGWTSLELLLAVPVSDPSCAMVVLVRVGWLMSRMTLVWARGVSLAWRKVQYLRGVVPYSVCVTLHREC